MKLIPLGNTAFAKVDDSDYERVIERGIWSLIEWRGKQYAKRKYRKSKDLYPEYGTESMHNFITGWDYVDHKDGDGLNNQRSNLRHFDHQSNIQAQRPQQRAKSSPYRGVGWFKPKRKWRARLKIDGREVHIGYFDNEHEAALAWNEAARYHYGENTFQNTITEERR